MKYIYLLGIILLIIIFYFIYRKTIEHFSLPNYIQVFPQNGSVPLTVTFTPTYINEFSSFIINFGDGDKQNRANNDVFAHTYNKVGIYYGEITFKTGKRQFFNITVTA